MSNGSIWWQVLLGGNEVDTITRRDIADECRALAKDRSRFILPKAVQEKIKGFPKISYALRNVIVKLKDGTNYRRVLVYWNKVVVGVLGEDQIPFDARDVVDAESDPDFPKPT